MEPLTSSGVFTSVSVCCFHVQLRKSESAVEETRGKLEEAREQLKTNENG
jgi:hypothetical protein